MAKHEEPSTVVEHAGEEVEEVEQETQDILSMVRSEIANVFGSLLDSGKADIVDTADIEEPAAPSLTIKDIEAAAARAIRKAQDDMKAKAPAKKVEKESPPPPEKPPAQVGGLRKFFWGDE